MTVILYEYRIIKKKLNKKNNIVLIKKDKNISQIKLKEPIYSWGEVKKFCTQDGHLFFVKDNMEIDGIYGIASSKMYHDLGIATPQTFAVKSRRDIEDEIEIGSQDACSIPGIIVAKPKDVINDILIHFKNLKGKQNNTWDCLCNTELRELLLQAITPECLDQFVNILLLDTLRTDSDRHIENYFFYKLPDSNKFEGIIPIDLEYGEIFNFCQFSKISFKEFLEVKYSTQTPSGQKDQAIPYSARMKKICDLIQIGKLNKQQIALLKKCAAYDLPKLINSTCDKYNLTSNKNDMYNIISKLWEYNNKNLEQAL